MVGRGDVGQGIDIIIDHQACSVARVGRPQHRNHQVGAFGDAVAPEGLAEIGIVIGVAPQRRDIEEPGHAGGRIDQEPHGRGAGAVEAALEQVVGQHDGRGDVAQHVADAVLHRIGQRHIVPPGDRLQQQLVEGVVDLEEVAVHRLEWIVGLLVGGHRLGVALGHRGAARRPQHHGHANSQQSDPSRHRLRMHEGSTPDVTRPAPPTITSAAVRPAGDVVRCFREGTP